MTLRSRGGSVWRARRTRVRVSEASYARSGRRRLGRHADVRQHHVGRPVRRRRQHRRRLDGADADDGAAEARLVGADAGGQVGQGRLGARLAAQRLAGRLELAALTADAARPGVLAQRVDHGAADAALGEGLELDAATVVVAMRGVDQADHPVLHQVTEVDRVRHRRSHPTGNGLDERQAGDDTILRGHGVDGEVGHVVSGCRSRGRSRAPPRVDAAPL